MSATPSIVSGAVTGFVGNAGDTWLMCLYENKAIEGYTQGVAKFLGGMFDISTNLCSLDAANALVTCIKPTEYNLKGKAKVLVRKGTFDFGCIQTFGCASGDNCAQDTCSSFGNRISFETNIPIAARNTAAPAVPGGLVITPGSGELNIRWNSVQDPTGLSEVFAYYVAVYIGGTLVKAGHTESGLRQVTIGGLSNGTTYSVEVYAVSHNNVSSNPATGTGTPAGVPKAQIFNFCWGVNRTSPCPVPPENPTVNPGQTLTIIEDIANSGPKGRVRGVIKAGSTTISDKETTLDVYPAGGLFSVGGTYVMPSSTVTLTFEAYGWDGSKWVLAHTLTQQLVPSQINCTGISIAPFTASVKQGEKVTLTASVTPSSAQFDVQWKDRQGTVLGTCKTVNGSCQYIFDSTGKNPGTYYVKAYVPQGNCTSLESVIQVSPVLRQWNANIKVLDSSTLNPVEGASVTVGTQTKLTDNTGSVLFRVDEGTINITISKTGYSTFTTAELVFSDKNFNYSLAPEIAGKGSIHFVTLPAGAKIYLDGADQKVRTDNTISNIPSGDHKFILTLLGYNDMEGTVTVSQGKVTEVYAPLTSLSPGGKGALYIDSTPAQAAIAINGQAQGQKTPATVTDLPAGSHELTLSRTGYQDYTGTITITAGRTLYLRPTLSILSGTGTLEISSTPAGARVYIDGADTEKITPATILSLASGQHKYRLVLSGYSDATGTVIIEPGMTATKAVQLSKSMGTAGLVGIAIMGTGAVAAVIYALKKKEP